MSLLNSKNVNINTLNLVKNSIQYLLGTILYFMTFGKLSLNFVLGLIGFLTAYHSVYQFNDLMDYEEDKKNDFKLKIKLLPRGDIKREKVESYSFLFSLVGLAISFLVNNFFGILVALSLFLNFLHSSSFIRLKKSKYFLLPNIFIIEFIKSSLGWFALTSSISEFPFILISLFSLVYLTGYVYWKQDINNFWKNTKIKFLIGLSTLFYIVSFLIYPFRLALLIPIFLGSMLSIIRKYRSTLLIKLKVSYTIIFAISFCFLLSLVLLTTPSIAELNNSLNTKVELIKENVTKFLPEELRYELYSLNETISKNIEKIDKIRIDNLKYPFNW